MSHTVIVMRHGTYDSDSRGLDPNGRHQAQDAAHEIEKLKDDRPVVILTSPVRRAKETAGIVGDILDVDPSEVPWLDPETDPIGMLEVAHREVSKLPAETIIILVAHALQAAALAAGVASGPLGHGQLVVAVW